MAQNGMAATSHPAATLTAVDVLRRGGNALDAAIAACAMQCVVEPGSTGIGGDCFALYSHGGTTDIVAYNGAGRAPAATDARALTDDGAQSIPRHSPYAVTIPGAVEAWARLNADHGRLDLGELLRPAIAAARHGYPVTPRVAYDWQQQADYLRQDENAARIMLAQGRAPLAGEIHAQPELAETLAQIAEHGPSAFYGGEVADDIVDTLQARGGVHTAEDLRAHRGLYVAPISTQYCGHAVYECPPPGQGLAALLMLNILGEVELDADPYSVRRLNTEVEIARMAYAVRDASLSDDTPDPVDAILSRSFARKLAAQIDPDGAARDMASFVGTPHRDTVYIAVVDKDRNVASFINSIFAPFGSGIMTRRSGIMLHNRGQSFSLNPTHPNALRAGRRPMHTIIPGMAASDGRVTMSFGVMGGHYQAMGHAYVLTRILRDRLDVQTAIDMPRLFPLPGTMTVEAEAAVPAAVKDALRRRGYQVQAASRPIGGGQIVRIDWENGLLHGGSDPRKDGCALGY